MVAQDDHDTYSGIVTDECDVVYRLNAFFLIRLFCPFFFSAHFSIKGEIILYRAKHFEGFVHEVFLLLFESFFIQIYFCIHSFRVLASLQCFYTGLMFPLWKLIFGGCFSFYRLQLFIFLGIFIDAPHIKCHMLFFVHIH